jgi:hypothetical protein
MYTCQSKTKWWINLQKSIKIFEGAIFKNHTKKKFKQAPLTTWTEHSSYSCCSLVIFLDFLKHILSNSVSNQLKKKSKKIVVVKFFYFLNFALKNTFPSSPHTCIQINEW